MALPFEIVAKDPDSRARRGRMQTAHGVVETPVFMDVGTRATVTNCAPSDLKEIATQVVLGNTYHLMLRPGPETFRKLGLDPERARAFLRRSEANPAALAAVIIKKNELRHSVL